MDRTWGLSNPVSHFWEWPGPDSSKEGVGTLRWQKWDSLPLILGPILISNSQRDWLKPWSRGLGIEQLVYTTAMSGHLQCNYSWSFWRTEQLGIKVIWPYRWRNEKYQYAIPCEGHKGPLWPSSLTSCIAHGRELHPVVAAMAGIILLCHVNEAVLERGPVSI